MNFSAGTEPPVADKLAALSLQDVWGSIQRHKAMMSACVGTFLLLAVVYLIITPRQYYAESVLLFEKQETNIDIQAVIAGEPMDVAFVTSEIQVLSSRNLMEATLEQLHLLKEQTAESPEEKIEAEQKKTARIDGYIRKLDIKQVEKSRAIRLGFYSRDPVQAADVVNTLVTQYIDQQQESRYGLITRTNSWLEDKVKSLQLKVAESENAVVEYRKKHGLVDNHGADLIDQQIADLSGKATDAHAALTAAESKLKDIGDASKLATSPAVLDSVLIQRLRERESESQAALAELTDEYGADHPKRMAAKSKVEEIERKIKEETDKIAEGIKSEHAIAKDNAERIDAQLAKLKEEYGSSRSANVELQELEGEAAANRGLLETLNARWKQTQSQGDERVQDPNVRVISPAIVPADPSKPKVKLVLIGALLAGLFLGAALSIAAEQLQSGVYNGKQLQALTGSNNLAVIPLTELAPEKDIFSLKEYPLKAAFSAYTESLRTISMALRVAVKEDAANNVFNATSVTDSEGKTSTIIGLARQMAIEGLKVLVVDCDLRHPALSEQFSLSGKPGLTDMLDGKISLAKSVMQDTETSLHILCAGTFDDVNIFSKQHDIWTAFITQVKKHYDVVLLDSPPILCIADNRLIARDTQNILFVRCKKTPVKQVAYAADTLKRLECKLFGTVLTMADENLAYGYSKYYVNPA